MTHCFIFSDPFVWGVYLKFYSKIMSLMDLLHITCLIVTHIQGNAMEVVWYKHAEAELQWLQFCRWPSQMHSLNWIYEFRLKVHWNLFKRVKLTIFQHWFREWLGADQATCHYLNQWCLLTHKCVTRPQWETLIYYICKTTITFSIHISFIIYGLFYFHNQIIKWDNSHNS